VAQPHLIVVDGYNLILRTPQLRPEEGRSMHDARKKLLNLLAWTVGGAQARFIVVFDGAESGGREGGGAGRVAVRFSRPPEKADDLIRRIVEEEIGRVEHLTVVTADLEVARHARAMGADVALSDLFLASALGPRAAEDPEKPSSLSKKDLEEWAAIFRDRRPGDPGSGEPGD
jgi:predicted RNA-binding protein with PIN domain